MLGPQYSDFCPLEGPGGCTPGYCTVCRTACNTDGLTNHYESQACTPTTPRICSECVGHSSPAGFDTLEESQSCDCTGNY